MSVQLIAWSSDSSDVLTCGPGEMEEEVLHLQVVDARGVKWPFYVCFVQQNIVRRVHCLLPHPVRMLDSIPVCCQNNYCALLLWSLCVSECQNVVSKCVNPVLWVSEYCQCPVLPVPVVRTSTLLQMLMICWAFAISCLYSCKWLISHWLVFHSFSDLEK